MSKYDHENLLFNKKENLFDIYSFVRHPSTDVFNIIFFHPQKRNDIEHVFGADIHVGFSDCCCNRVSLSIRCVTSSHTDKKRLYMFSFQSTFYLYLIEKCQTEPLKIAGWCKDHTRTVITLARWAKHPDEIKRHFSQPLLLMPSEHCPIIFH